MELTSQPSGELATLPSGAPLRRSDPPPHQLDPGTVVDQSRSAWDRHSALVTVATIIGIVVVSGAGTRQLLACLFCALTIGFYFSTRRYTDPTAAGHRPGVGLAIMGGLAVLFAVAVYFEFWAGFLMAALCPIAFFSTGMVWGHGVNAMFCLVPTVAGWARTGDLRHALTEVAPWSLISLAFSTLTALVIARMVGRNRANQALLVRLAAEQDQTVQEVRLDAVAQERQRLAGDLHDTVTQGPGQHRRLGGGR